MKFDDWIQGLIELNLSFAGKIPMAIASLLAKVAEAQCDILGECNQKIANAKINHQKCYENFKNTEKKQQLKGGRQQVCDRCSPIEWQSNVAMVKQKN